MHSLRINVEDSVLDKILYFLNNLPKSEVQIVEDIVVGANCNSCIDFSKYTISDFKKIEDPVEWQRKIRSEWDRVE